jgi:hypothetical protein
MSGDFMPISLWMDDEMALEQFFFQISSVSSSPTN